MRGGRRSPGFGHALKCVFLVVERNFQAWRGDPRFPMVFLFVFVMMCVMLDPLKEFALQLGYASNVAVLPFVLSSETNQLVVAIGCVLLFSDAPFLRGDQLFVVERTGRRVWIAGQLVYLLVASFLYVAFVVASSVLVMMPVSTFATEGWGKVVSTLVYTDAASLTGIGFPFSPKLVVAFSPGQAMAVQFAVEWAAMLVLSAVVFVCNLFLKAKIGVFVAMAVALFDLLITNMLPFVMTYASPVSMGRLSILDLSGGTSLYFPGLRWALCFGFVVFLLLALASVALSSQARIVFDSEV